MKADFSRKSQMNLLYLSCCDPYKFNENVDIFWSNKKPETFRHRMEFIVMEFGTPGFLLWRHLTATQTHTKKSKDTVLKNST